MLNITEDLFTTNQACETSTAHRDQKSVESRLSSYRHNRGPELAGTHTG